jgi:hypothetical protein
VAMDGGAFVVSPLVGDIGWAWRMAHRRRAHAPLDKRRAITPPSPYYFLIVVCHQLLPLAGGLVTPITIDAPLASRRDENNVIRIG